MERFVPLGGFSFECREVIGFALTTLYDWLKQLVPIFCPIGSKILTNHDSLIHIFPHFMSAICNFFELWFVTGSPGCLCLLWLIRALATSLFHSVHITKLNLIFMFPDSSKLQMDLKNNKREKLDIYICDLWGQGC